MRSSTTFIFCLLFCAFTCAVQAQISGRVTDGDSGEALVGVNVITGNGVGTSTDADGKWSLTLPAGEHTLRFSFVGYRNTTIDIHADGKAQYIETTLFQDDNELDVLVVSGSLYEKKLTEETVSMEVVKASLIEHTNSTSLNEAILKAPGVYMMDEQANIRGGTGFTYGAGSRVMLVVDDQILLSADRGDAKWNFVPLENVEQVEIIKGASSVLYGSSALNGVISVRTAWPGIEPVTKVTMYHGMYSAPDFAPAKWWETAPTFTGMQFAHRQRFDKVDLVLGGHISENNSYLLGQYSDRARLNWKTRFHTGNDKKISYGVNGNLMSDREGMYFLWAGVDTGAFIPFQGYLDTSSTTLLNWQHKWMTIDPWLNYFDDHGNAHKCKMRFYHNNVNYSDTTSGAAWLLNFDYQLHHAWENDLVLTTGVSGYDFHVRDHDLGDHDGISAGVYVQLDKKLFDRLSLNVGLREEFYTVDTTAGSAVPIFKGGANYRLGRRTWLRGSFGQGYRFPSLVEKFASTHLGSLYIFPNPDLSAEYGWNTEFGVKRSLTAEHFNGFADIAFYLTDYFDMTEFTFNYYTGEGLGFKSLNTNRARIGGMEITLSGEGELWGNTISFSGGYNYIYPADIAGDSSNLDLPTFMGNFIDGFSAHSNDSAFLASVLKYRFRHMLRMDVEYMVKKFSFGTDINYFSLMENLDAIYIQFIPGIEEYRGDHMHGDWIFDFRAGYQCTQNIKVQCLVKNAFNRMYALRPAKYDAPRSFTFQMSVDL
ncbi:MAG: TonB-dependent receptor [Chitinophagales bacterium]